MNSLLPIPEETKGALMGALGLMTSMAFKWIYIETIIQAGLAATVSVVAGYLVRKAIIRVEKWIYK